MKRRDDNLLNVIKRRGVRSSALLGDINKCIRKLERLERLADDLKRFSKSSADVTIFSLENEVIPVHRFIIQVRAPRLVSVCF
ncbi:unnamed protein product [Anisakis simplex]|uniref:BTB domain-containing protein n=1 Tax=Anisakis simplex TaxID=6269 RepID=A0A0M3JF34_ANISI|nr:unnamed protein product [Anisakis simplex]